MLNENFYEFRLRVRKILGRSILYPENYNVYEENLIEIFKKDKDTTIFYLNNCTNNEIDALKSFLKHLKESNKSKTVLEILEGIKSLN